MAKKDDKADATAYRIPGILEDASFRKSQQDYKLVMSVPREFLRHIQPIQKQINYPFLAMFIPVGNVNQAKDLADRDVDAPAIPDGSEGEVTGECTGVQLAEILLMTPRNVQLLAKKGTLVKIDRDRYDIVKSVQGYIRELRTQVQGQGDAALVEERKGLVRAQREKAELEVLVRKGQLVVAEDTRKEWEKTFATFRSHLLSLPVKVAPLIRGAKTQPQIKEILETHVRDYLHELSGASVGRGGDGGGAENPNPAPKAHRKRVGRRKKASKSRK